MTLVNAIQIFGSIECQENLVHPLCRLQHELKNLQKFYGITFTSLHTRKMSEVQCYVPQWRHTLFHARDSSLDGTIESHFANASPLLHCQLPHLAWQPIAAAGMGQRYRPERVELRPGEPPGLPPRFRP